MKAQEVKEYMNELGKKGTPFLFAVDFDMEEGLFVPAPLEQGGILFRTPLGGSRSPQVGIPAAVGGIACSPISFDEYLPRFQTVMQGLMRGNSYLTNLTVRTPVQTALSLEDIFHVSRSPYALCVPGGFVCFSPERFVRIAGGMISANPMKGTISADIPDAAQNILNDPKERAEHCTIVDLIRNDIGMVAEDVRVSRFRYIDRINAPSGDILQVSSEITGRLCDDYLSRLGDIIFRMLPAGSVSGAPKISTVDLIRRAEPEPRGYYTGVFGYFDGRELDTAVMIRFIGLDDDGIWYHSGGGITVNSSPGSEYDEVLQKIYIPAT